MKGVKLTHDLVNAKTGKTVAEAGAKMTPRLLNRLKEAGLKEMRVSAEELIGRYAALDIINEKNGEIYVEAGQEITAGGARPVRRGRHRRAADAGHRPHQRRARTSATPSRPTRTRTARKRCSTSTA